MTREEVIRHLEFVKIAEQLDAKIGTPNILALDVAIQTLGQSCEDYVSRQAIKEKKVYSQERHEYVVPVAEIDWLPSATPARINGRWIERVDQYDKIIGQIPYTGGVTCSVCGYETHNKLQMQLGCPFNECPLCGSDMRGDVNANSTD